MVWLALYSAVNLVCLVLYSAVNLVWLVLYSAVWLILSGVANLVLAGTA